MENLSDLEKLGHYFLQHNPKDALNVLRENILSEINFKKENMIDKEESVILKSKEKYSYGNGEIFGDIDVLFLSSSHQDIHNFWRLYVDKKDVEWIQKSGIGFEISKSTFLVLNKVIINGKGVLFAHPSSVIVNWKSVETVSKHISNEFNTKYINDEFSSLAHFLELH